MPKINMTQLAAERLQPPDGKEAVTRWDTNLPGFGCRVSPKGRKTWVAQYRVKGSKEVRETIGTINILPKVAVARERARASMVKARDGIDPRAQRRHEVQPEKTKAAPTLTFTKLVDRYVAEYCKSNTKPSSTKETAR